MNAAWEEFTRVSFAEASTNQIVRRAGVPRGSFYQYFRDKEDLFVYLMIQARDHFIEIYARTMEEAGGNFFRTQMMCFDRFAQREPETDMLFERCIQVLFRTSVISRMYLTESLRENLLSMNFSQSGCLRTNSFRKK